MTFIAQPLTEEQVRLFLTIIQGHRLEALYHIALGLGLRKGEILGLRWEDVDLDRAVICITGALQRQNGRLERSATKTEASVRVLALPPNQVVSLRRHQARQNAECVAAPRWRASGMVFTSTIGTPLAPETLSQHFKAALEAAELPIIRFHDLRHTCATLMLKRGVSPRLIQEVLGHSQITTTIEHLHACPGRGAAGGGCGAGCAVCDTHIRQFRHESGHTGGIRWWICVSGCRRSSMMTITAILSAMNGG